MVEEEKDVKRAMEFLHECDLLKIEDILPFFPDFVTIDHFKVGYQRHLDTLQAFCLFQFYCLVKQNLDFVRVLAWCIILVVLGSTTL